MENLKNKSYEMFVKAYETQLKTATIPKGLDKPIERMPEQLLRKHFDIITNKYSKYMFKQMIKFLAVINESK